jgi:hypothetical protein
MLATASSIRLRYFVLMTLCSKHMISKQHIQYRVDTLANCMFRLLGTIKTDFSRNKLKEIDLYKEKYHGNKNKPH